MTGEEAAALILAGRSGEIIGFRRLGVAAMVSPRLNGWLQYGVFGTKPGKLATFYEGRLDFAGGLHPMRPDLIDWELNDPLSRDRGRRWVAREGYYLELDAHRVRYNGLGGVRCSCGWRKVAAGHGLARLEFTIHTSNLTPERLH